MVTGGASGLGKALCLQLAGRGVSVAVADLSEERASETVAQMARSGTGSASFAVACDVRREGDFEALRGQIKERWGGRLDMLFNNAGIAAAGPLLQTTAENWRTMIDTNLLGVVRGCRVLAPLLCENGRGHIVNVASFAGIACAPGMITYNVSKAGVIALSESLRGEFQPSGVGVSVACPAFFTTNLLDNFNAPSEVTERVRRMMQRSEIQADDVARDILESVQHDRFMVISHKQARRGYLLKRLLPEQFFKAVQRQTKHWYRKTKSETDA